MKLHHLFLAAAFLATTSVLACWYQRVNYTDYISSVNTTPQIVSYEIVSNASKNTTFQKYHVENNKVVDLPVTVVCKLTSGNTTQFSSDVKSQIVTCLLQYRVLPNGNWVTVKQYLTASGSIPFTAPANAYFGKNNIWPKDIRAGDVIMIRMYITDGIYQSGNLLDKCEDKLQDVSTTWGTKKALPDIFEYTIGQTPLEEYDLGGGWCPNQCITVIWSGNTRPTR